MNQSVCGSMADGGDDEVMLELSIGGIFGKPKKSIQTVSESIEKGDRIDRIDGMGDFNAQLKDLKRKREEKMKKSLDLGSCGSVSGPFVENKEWLESQVVRRNGEPVCKKEKVGLVDVNCGLRQVACRSFRRNDGGVGGGGGGRCYCKVNANGCASLVYSDGHCSDHQGGGTDESRSNSNNSQLDQQPASTSTASIKPFDRSDQPTGSPKRTISTTKSPDTTITTPSTPSNPHESTSSQHQQAALLARMPYVSTTGNGPNGRTVSGFLYRYTKHEVSIVCVCHGRSFSPAGFVEHAGGVDIAHPLKHITIFPAAFTS